MVFPFDGDLIGYWHYDTNSGTNDAVDDSSNSNDGDLVGTATRDGGVLPPIANNTNSLLLDGSGAMEIPGSVTTPLDMSPDYTVAAWFNTSSSAQIDIYGGSNQAGSAHNNLLEINSGVLRFLHREPAANSGGIDLFSGGGFADGAWHHVAGVKDGTNLILYVDGSSVASTTGAPDFTTDIAVVVGQQTNLVDTRRFIGNIDDVRIYDVALSARQIGQLASGIVITKELLSTANLDTPADTTLNLNENWQFVMKVTVTNNSDSPFDLEDIVITDPLPGDLELGDMTSVLKNNPGGECPDGGPELTVTEGVVDAFATGNSSKCHVIWTFDSLDEIAPGDSIMLTMDTSTDVNPRGLRKPPKDGQSFQEYTSGGPYCINQGATIFDDGVFVTQSNGLEVDSGTIVSETSATINNASFENPALADGTASAPGVPQWFSTVGTGVLDPSSAVHFTGEAPEGENVGTVFAGNALLAQTLAETLTAGKTYTLDVEVGDAKNIAFPGYEVALVAGLSFPPNIIASQDQNDVAVADDSFATVTVEFFASAIDPNLGEPLSILLLSNGIATFFDDVSLTITMPVVDMVEPEDCGS